jgi:hypothetical protein
MQRRIYPGILFIGSQKVNIFFFAIDLSFNPILEESKL